MSAPSREDVRNASALASALAEARRRRWIRLRELGWLLIASWQLLSLVSEFYPVLNLESKALRVAGKLLGLVGLFLVAYGFERIMALAERKVDEGAPRAG